MQYKNSEFNPDEHDRYPALTVKQPYADNLVTFDQEIDGVKYAVKRIEVRSKKTKFRGFTARAVVPLYAGEYNKKRMDRYALFIVSTCVQIVFYFMQQHRI